MAGVTGDLDQRLAAADTSDDPDTLNELGCDLADAGRHLDAERCFRRAVDLGASWVALNLGNSLAAQRRWADAATSYRQAADAGDPEARLGLAEALEELGDRTGAMRAYRQASDAGDSRGTLELALMLRQRGEHAEAEQLAQRAADAGNRAAAAALACWAWDSTLDPTLEAALRAGADHSPSARACLADLLRTTDRVAEARSVLERGAKLGERESWLPLGNLYLDELGDDDAAEAAYRSAIEAGDGYAHHNLGLLLTQRGDMAGAEEQFRLGAETGDEAASLALRRLRGDKGLRGD
jgi:TPR repeat protein